MYIVCSFRNTNIIYLATARYIISFSCNILDTSKYFTVNRTLYQSADGLP